MVQEYGDDNRMLIVENFDEVEQLYTCEQWGAFAEENLPMIFTDGTHNNVLKIKPPMVFSIENAQLVIDSLQVLFSKLS